MNFEEILRVILRKRQIQALTVLQWRWRPSRWPVCHYYGLSDARDDGPIVNFT